MHALPRHVVPHPEQDSVSSFFVLLFSILKAPFSDRFLPPLSILPPHIPTHSKATNPDRVFAGVVQQNSQGDVDCLYGYCEMIKEERGLEPKTPATGPAAKVLENCPHADQVRMLRVASEDAKGPTYGRYLGSKLLGKEEFCMQIDAHMDFEDDWDKQLLDMWGEWAQGAFVCACVCLEPCAR